MACNCSKASSAPIGCGELQQIAQICALGCTEAQEVGVTAWRACRPEDWLRSRNDAGRYRTSMEGRGPCIGGRHVAHDVCGTLQGSRGTALLDYLIRWRMTIARSALKADNDSLSNIAASVGYASDAALSSTFKKLFGLSPGRYRSQAKEQSMVAES
jgi:hypothetical protein